MWFLYGLTSGLFDALYNIVIRGTREKVHPFLMTWFLMTVPAVLYVPYLFLVPWPQLDHIFWVALFVRTILDTFAMITYVRSVQSADISLSLPMLAFTPFFLLLIDWVVNGSVPGVLAIVGIFMIIFGMYALYLPNGSTDWLAPFRAIQKTASARSMFLVAALWGVTGSLHALAIHHSSALFYSSFGTLVLAGSLGIIVTIVVPRQSFRVFKEKRIVGWLLLGGLFMAVATIAQFIGQGQTIAVYVLSLKRLSIVFSILFAAFFFKEKIGSRLVPVIGMVVGAMLITLYR